MQGFFFKSKNKPRYRTCTSDKNELFFIFFYQNRSRNKSFEKGQQNLTSGSNDNLMAVMQMRIRIKEDHLDPDPGRRHEKLLEQCCPITGYSKNLSFSIFIFGYLHFICDIFLFKKKYSTLFFGKLGSES